MVRVPQRPRRQRLLHSHPGHTGDPRRRSVRWNDSLVRAGDRRHQPDTTPGNPCGPLCRPSNDCPKRGWRNRRCTAAASRRHGSGRRLWQLGRSHTPSELGPTGQPARRPSGRRPGHSARLELSHRRHRPLGWLHLDLRRGCRHPVDRSRGGRFRREQWLLHGGTHRRHQHPAL